MIVIFDPYSFNLTLRLNKLSYRNEIGLRLKLFTRAFIPSPIFYTFDDRKIEKISLPPVGSMLRTFSSPGSNLDRSKWLRFSHYGSEKHLIIHFHTSSEVSEWAREQTNERSAKQTARGASSVEQANEWMARENKWTDQQVDQYLCPNCWLFWTTVSRWFKGSSSVWASKSNLRLRKPRRSPTLTLILDTDISEGPKEKEEGVQKAKITVGKKGAKGEGWEERIRGKDERWGWGWEGKKSLNG